MDSRESKDWVYNLIGEGMSEDIFRPAEMYLKNSLLLAFNDKEALSSDNLLDDSHLRIQSCCNFMDLYAL